MNSVIIIIMNSVILYINTQCFFVFVFLSVWHITSVLFFCQFHIARRNFKYENKIFTYSLSKGDKTLANYIRELAECGLATSIQVV